MKSVFLLLVTSLVLGACAQTRSQAPDQGNVLAKVYAYQFRQNALWFQTVSNGCTSAQNFEVKIVETNQRGLEATVIQLKPDYCRAKPRLIAVEIALPSTDSNATEITLINPIEDKSAFSKLSRTPR